jgi:hypothetical protein
VIEAALGIAANPVDIGLLDKTGVYDCDCE